VLRAQFLGRSTRRHDYQAAKALIAAAGSLAPQDLRVAYVTEVDDAIHDSGFTHSTKSLRSAALRRILRWLWEYHGAPKLDDHVRRYPGLRPRNVTASEAERESIFAAAPDHLLLWLLLCSDLAIRSGTAARLAPEHYDPMRNTLTFTTKCGEKLTLPVTAEIEALIGQCDLSSDLPFARQLWIRRKPKGLRHRDHNSQDTLNYAFRKLKVSLGITRKLTPHDFRRTTAVAMLRHTHDVRDVQALLGHRSLQSTIWYLDHDLRPVKRATLELIKSHKWRKEEYA
jgi:integrase